jgi:pyruvate kinase
MRDQFYIESLRNKEYFETGGFSVTATLGPALGDTDKIHEAISLGIRHFRQPLAYGNQDHWEQLKIIRQFEKHHNVNLVVMSDFPSNRPRVGVVKSEKYYIPGDRVVIRDLVESRDSCEIPLPGLSKYITSIQADQKILIRDGSIVIKIVAVTEHIKGVVLSASQPIKSNNNVFLPDSIISFEQIRDTDIQYLKKLKRMGTRPNFVVLSFCNTSLDVADARQQLQAIYSDSPPGIITKIETSQSMDNLHDIVRESDIIMVARGDLGLALPIEKLPRLQAEIIHVCHNMNTPVIVGTQFLENFSDTGVPNRSEITDISLAFKQGANGIMLSRETSGGTDSIAVLKLALSILSSCKSKGSNGRNHSGKNKRYPIIAIEGADGTGKTSVAKELAQVLDGVYIPTPPNAYQHLREFFEEPERSHFARFFFYTGALWESWTQIEHQSRLRPVVLDRWTLSLELYHELLIGMTISGIIENAIPPRADLDIILTASDDVISERLCTKSGSTFDKELHHDLDFQKAVRSIFQTRGKYIMDTSQKGITEIVGNIEVLINSGLTIKDSIE